MLERAKEAGVGQCIFTGGSLSESEYALQLAHELGAISLAPDLHAAPGTDRSAPGTDRSAPASPTFPATAAGQTATVGLHPTRATELASDPAAYVSALSALIVCHRSHVVALGELGLDNDRLHFASAEAQRTAFVAQLELAKQHNLPLFLHSRAAHDELVSILREHRSLWERRGGVVHSFTGTVAEVGELVELGLDVGINGCSLKTVENLAAVAALPLERLQLETDAPYCLCTSSHASTPHLASIPADASWAAGGLIKANKADKWKEGEMVKGRAEPNGVGRIAWVVAQVKGVPVEDVAAAAWRNSRRMFFGDGDLPSAGRAGSAI